MKATYYDGRTALAHEVDLSVDRDSFVVSGAGLERREPVAAVEIGDALGSAPRVLRFVDGASCEVADNAEFAALLASQGLAASRVSVWEKSWRLAVVSLALILLAGVAGYRHGLPVLAQTAANRLPASALDSLSFQIQRVLDRTVFSRTEIDGRRMLPLLKMFDGLELPGGVRGRLTLNFRSARTLGANAMALPSGAVFVTDDLLKLTNDDRLIVAVIAHEAGHVARRHGLRQVIQSSVVGILVTWYLGDVSALGAAAPAALLNAKYSRDLEREADAYAVQVLKMNGVPVSVLADALVLLEKSRGGDGRGEGGALAYLSSHPATAERLAWIRAQ